MFGKYSTLLLRLTAILQAIKNAFKLLSDIKTASNKTLTNEFQHELKDTISKFPENLYIIDKKVVQQANIIMEYFFKHKLILSGYDFSFKDGPFDSIIIDYLKKTDKKDEIIEQLIPQVNAKINIVVKKIFMHEQQSMNTTTILAKGRFNQAEVELAFKKLEEAKLGTLSSVKSGNNKYFLKFTRIEKNAIIQNLSIFNAYQSYGLKLEDYYGKINLNQYFSH